jgi:hypothetical protein
MSSGGNANDGYAYEYVPAAMCFNEKATTPFVDLSMDEMKAMIINAKPGDVHAVARGWTKVNNDLVGEDGRGGSRQDFLDAVHGVLEHWQGEAADRFKAQAEVIAKKMLDGSQYAQYTSLALTNAATALENIKPEVEAMQKPGVMSRAGHFIADGFSHDDSGYQADRRAGMSSQELLDKHQDDLSAGKDAQLRMAVKMEELGAAYASQTRAMGSWSVRPREETHDYPGSPGGTVPVPIVAIPTETGPRLMGRTSTGSRASSGTARSAITAPPNAPNAPQHIAHAGTGPSSDVPPPSGIGTAVDSLATGSPHGTGAGNGGGHVGIGGSRFGGASAGFGAGSGSGGGGGFGAGDGFPGTFGGPAGGSARSGSARSGSSSGVGSAGANGRSGMGGMGGGSGARSGSGKQAVGGRGPLARTRGGVIGEAEEAPSSGARAGSGLHGSRGGTTEGRTAAGLSGSGQGRDSKKKDGKPIPDYLVEDEETWVPKRDDTTPRVIE